MALAQARHRAVARSVFVELFVVSLGAQVLFPAVIQDAVQPGMQPLRVTQLMRLMQARGQGFLYQVVGKHRITTPRQGHSEQALPRRGNLFALAVRQTEAFNEFHTP